jgi:hypothetical protein
MIQSCCFLLFLKLWPYSFRIDFFFLWLWVSVFTSLGVQSLGLLFSTSDCLWIYHCQPLAFLQFLALTLF